MAIDEVLLQTAPGAVLRFYRWREPTVSFGYFGKLEEARAFSAGRALVRRWTGGGMVPHGDDLTYSLIAYKTDPAAALSARVIYEQVHATIANCLARAGIRASLSPANAARRSDACFANPVIADVMANGHKIAGAAQRRTRAGFLHQGSIQSRDLGQEFPANLANALAGELTLTDAVNPSVLEEAEHLARRKYASETWLGRC